MELNCNKSDTPFVICSCVLIKMTHHATVRVQEQYGLAIQKGAMASSSFPLGLKLNELNLRG